MKLRRTLNGLVVLAVALCLAATIGCAKKEADAPASEDVKRPAVVNVRCPIMNNPVDPKKVPDTLYRKYKGQGIGFCCPGCPAAWDALTDSQKAEKLAKAMPK